MNKALTTIVAGAVACALFAGCTRYSQYGFMGVINKVPVEFRKGENGSVLKERTNYNTITYFANRKDEVTSVTIETTKENLADCTISTDKKRYVNVTNLKYSIFILAQEKYNYVVARIKAALNNQTIKLKEPNVEKEISDLQKAIERYELLK